MEIKEIKKLEKNLTKYYCQTCNFKCSQKCDWDRHVIRPKHLVSKDGNQMETKKLEKNFFCNCGKKFQSNSGLWKHKQKCDCKEEDIIKSNSNLNYKNISELTDNEIIKTLLKIVENGTHNTSHSHNNNNNKTFNLNFFLNETCKDAMNINDFVSSIKVSLSDLENTGRQGYIEGITNIVLQNLNKVEESMRPIHCSDVKREVFYIKDNNEWQKENEEKPILTKAIKVIANENIKQIKLWRDKYPDCTDSDSKKNNLYLKIVGNSMNGSTQEEGNKNIDKIISNVAKEVIIDKTHL
jgi:hypothetical protein